MFDARIAPLPGDAVLLRDINGGHHIRLYRQGVGRWEAHATNEAYQPLDSERDGLQVLAVLTGVMARWS